MASNPTYEDLKHLVTQLQDELETCKGLEEQRSKSEAQVEEEKKQFEEQLRHFQKMEAVGILAGGFAHDFNNVLMGIQGRVSLMQHNTDSKHPNREHLVGIEKMIGRGAELTRQLLGFARGGKDEARLTNINDLVKKSSKLFARAKKELKVHRTFQEGLWTVKVHRSQIDQVLLNLYINAWRAISGGGDVYIETENVTVDEDYGKSFDAKPGKYVRIAVKDTGIGMDDDTRQRIFEPFFSTKEMARGTGLGLSLAHGVIKNHGGFMHAQSEAGQGSTFSAYLPVTGEKVPVVTPTPEQKIVKGKETILLVDDEEIILEVGEKLLNALGYNVIIARSGRDAVKVFEKRKQDVDMVILDMVMPDMGGHEAYSQLKNINPEIKVLLSSGYGLDGQAGKVLELGCNGFVQKPFNMKVLSQKVRQVLREK
jgi:signal transduction histidine kinase/ActR/RegA family two-component response regulator